MSRRTGRVDLSGDGAGSLAQFEFKGPCCPSRQLLWRLWSGATDVCNRLLSEGVAMDHCRAVMGTLDTGQRSGSAVMGWQQRVEDRDKLGFGLAHSSHARSQLGKD
jgi:hypothetical protein